MRQLSSLGRAQLTEPWEECVLYVYDDKVPKRRNAQGHLVYPEWDGGPVRGTLTIGFGHTDAAGVPKIVQGMRITREEADDILSADLAPCERRVNVLLRVPVTQHQYDSLVDIDFNCPSAIPHVISLVNSGDWPAAERVMLQYVNSKGERMAGLVNRRHAEIMWANTPDDPEEAAAIIMAPKAERAPQPSVVRSPTGAGAMTIGAGGAAAALDAANKAAPPIEEAQQHLIQLGLYDHILAAAHSPMFWVGVAILAAAGFIWFVERDRLRSYHV